MRQIFVFLVFGVLVLGCKTKAPNQQNKVQILEVQTDQPIIRLTKGGCFGTCPVYALDIYSDGRVVFTPRKFTLTTEVQSAQWPIIPLIGVFEEAEFRQLDTLYFEPIADIPTYTLSFQTHKVSWNAGAPDNLRYLVTKLDQLCLDEGWLETFGVGEISFEPNQVIVQIKDSNVRNELLQAYSFCDLVWLKSLDTEGKYGLLSFDKEVIKMVDLLDKLALEPQVIAVSRNHFVQERGQ